jgi:hypothetical protein
VTGKSGSIRSHLPNDNIICDKRSRGSQCICSNVKRISYLQNKIEMNLLNEFEMINVFARLNLI